MAPSTVEMTVVKTENSQVGRKESMWVVQSAEHSDTSKVDLMEILKVELKADQWAENSE